MTQMTTEERVAKVEEAILKLADCMTELIDIQRGHEARLNGHEASLQRQDSILEEMRRDNAMTRRLWVKLAERYGWTDEDGLFSE